MMLFEGNIIRQLRIWNQRLKVDSSIKLAVFSCLVAKDWLSPRVFLTACIS
jgi:hypothetical protein